MRAALSVLVLVSACAGPQFSGEPRTTVVSLSHLDCAECGERLARNMRAEAGVRSAKFDKRRAELTVVAAPAVDAVGVARAMKEEDYEILPGAGHGAYVAWPRPAEGLDVKAIAEDGQDVPDLAPHVAPGKITVFDFYAAWCEPCRALDAYMLDVLKTHRNVAYRKLDIGDWDTPLARRYMKGVPTLPFAVVFDATGKRAGQVAGLDLGKIERLVEGGVR